MSTVSGSRAFARGPVRQRVRIWLLRLVFLSFLPLILSVRPVLTGGPVAVWLMEMAGTFLIFAAVLGRFWAILYIGAEKNRVVMDAGP